MCLLVDVLIARKMDESCAHVPFEDSCLCFNQLVVCKKKKRHNFWYQISFLSKMLGAILLFHKNIPLF